MHERHAESLAQTEADQLAIPMVDVSLSSSGTSDEIPVGEQSVPVSLTLKLLVQPLSSIQPFKDDCRCLPVGLLIHQILH